MNKFGLTLLLLTLAALFGCEQSNTFDEAGAQFAPASSMEQRGKNRFLAYEHRISVELEKANFLEVFNQVIDKCVKDTEHQCIVMSSSHNAGDVTYAGIQLRVAPAGVKNYMEFISSSGEISSQSTTAEDLTDVIADTEKRLEMLTRYRAKLEELESDPKNTIDSLIKISSELAEVQTQLEFSQGEKAKLYQRVSQEILHISMQSKVHESSFGPIGEALDEFGENAAEGMSVFITAVAYLLPWIFVLWFVVYMFRVIWRRTRKGS